jgi:hypothetical protein
MGMSLARASFDVHSGRARLGQPARALAARTRGGGALA